jgi:hypothetical protein
MGKIMHQGTLLFSARNGGGWKTKRKATRKRFSHWWEKHLWLENNDWPFSGDAPLPKMLMSAIMGHVESLPDQVKDL